jgi:hypothetical protein
MRLLIALLASSLAAVSSANASVDTYLARGSGTITIGADGSVIDVAVAERFGNGVDAALAESMRGWRFEPVLEHGRVVEAIAHMEFTLVAEQHASNDFRVRVGRVAFVDPPGQQAAPSPKLVAPTYPRDRLRERQGALTEVLLQLDADGRVIDAAPLGGWLLGPRRGTPESSMRRFNEASLAAARRWTLPPCEDEAPCLRRAPIRYEISGGPVWVRAHRVAPEPHPLRDAAVAGARPVTAGGIASTRFTLLTPVEEPQG